MNIDQSTINFDMYEDGSEYYGLAKVTMPDITYLTQTISGAGIAGNLEVAVTGMLEAMTLGVDFRTITDHAVKLLEPRSHNIDLRAAVQEEDTVAGVIGVTAIKHVMIIMPKSLKGGQLAPASTADASGEYACRYWAMYRNGEKSLELDPANFICYINGYDYLTQVRKALGK